TSVVLAVAAVVAQDKPPKLVLFDGKTLEGWKPTDYSNGGEIKAEDGSIVMKVGRPMSGITCTRRDLPTPNYELTDQDERLTGRGCFAATRFAVGKSFITLVNGGWGGNVTGLSSLNGADASENETSTYVRYQDKTWYTFRIWVTDKAIRCWIDDKKVVDADIE